MNEWFSDLDQYLFGEGRHFEIYNKLGAHPAVVNGEAGARFAVWAPNASGVAVVGDFNQWDGRCHPMAPQGASGVWAAFVPGVHAGDKYKFEVRWRDSTLVLKTDPYGRFFEVAPRTASIVHTSTHTWQDAAWMAARATNDRLLNRPLSVYEVHLGSWKRGDDNRVLGYRELAEQLVPYVKDLGFTHIELLPILEHPFSGSWGYQVTGFFAPTSRFGTPDDFKFFVDACHQAGIGVLLDWVPGHFPKDWFGLIRFDGTALYEHEDPRRGEHQDWGTLIFNYGRHEVSNFLLANALFWLDEYHLDGLRVDAVASMLYLDYSRKSGEWVPNQYGGRENIDAIEFLRQLNSLVHERHPGAITVAEESTAWPAVSRPVYLGGLGFTYKWNMGWMHDMLRYSSHEPVHRKWHQNDITFSMLYAFNENFVLPFSHDEVVHGKRSLVEKMPGDWWQKHANLRALLAFMYTHPGKKLLFMGSEIAQAREWNHDASVDWHLLDYEAHRGIQSLVRDLNHVLVGEPALHEQDHVAAGFTWIDCNDSEHSVVSFTRWGRQADELVVVVVNFTPVVREGYRIGVPHPGVYLERVNTDAGLYGGSNVGNGGFVASEPIERHGHAQSLNLTLPPLGCLILKYKKPDAER